MQRYVTDQQVSTITELQGSTPDEQAQAFQDAEQVYSFLRRSESQREFDVPEDSLRKWAEQQGLDPDRLTRAVGVLVGSGRVLTFPDSPPDVTAEPVENTPTGRQAAPDDPDGRRRNRREG